MTSRQISSIRFDQNIKCYLTICHNSDSECVSHEIMITQMNLSECCWVFCLHLVSVGFILFHPVSFLPYHSWQLLGSCEVDLLLATFLCPLLLQWHLHSVYIAPTASWYLFNGADILKYCLKVYINFSMNFKFYFCVSD